MTMRGARVLAPAPEPSAPAPRRRSRGALAATLAGCSSGVKLNDVPVVDQTASSSSTGSTGASAGGATTAQSNVATVTPREDGSFLVVGPDAVTVGNIAAQVGVPLHELTPTGASLEEAYMALTRDDVEYRSEGTR